MLTTKHAVLLPDLQIGNMGSVTNMIRKCGGAGEVVATPDRLHDDAKIILAGVGSFDAAMEAVVAGGWQPRLTDLVRNKRMPVLGICLGMQIMGHGSDEGRLPGLGWIDADVKRFDFPAGSPLKVPHMGWNTIDVRRPNPLLPQAAEEQRFYFVHSYHVVCRNHDDVLATTRYGGDVTAALARDNVYGVQFHPEKSHRFGMALIQAFLDL